MKSRSTLLLLLLLAYREPAFAQDSALSYGVETAFRSGHSDRGFLISDRAVFQPVVWLTARGTEASLWANFAMASATDGSRPTIVEAELTHSFDFNRLSIGPAVRSYVYHDPVNRVTSRSVETWLYLTYHVGPVSLFTNHSVDVLHNRGGWFGEVGIETEGKLSPGIEVGGLFSAGWANARFNSYWADVPKRAFDRVGAEAWFSMYPRPNLSIGPHIEVSSIVDRDVRRGDLYRPTFVLMRIATAVEF